jgi:cytochrome c oxidase subunit 2
MVGRIIVMEPPAYATWVGGGGTGGSMTAAGQKLFQTLGCATCHLPNDTGRGPSLVGLIGKTVALQGGKSVTADENYIRESILEPRAKIVRGYEPVMPIFKGSVSEEGVMQILSYIKSLTPAAGAQGNK